MDLQETARLVECYKAGAAAAVEMLNGPEFVGAWQLAEAAGHDRGTPEFRFYSAGAYDAIRMQ